MQYPLIQIKLSTEDSKVYIIQQYQINQASGKGA